MQWIDSLLQERSHTIHSFSHTKKAQVIRHMQFLYVGGKVATWANGNIVFALVYSTCYRM